MVTDENTPESVDEELRGCHGLWRDGGELIVAHGARFPNRCLITNRKLVEAFRYSMKMPAKARAQRTTGQATALIITVAIVGVVISGFLFRILPIVYLFIFPFFLNRKLPQTIIVPLHPDLLDDFRISVLRQLTVATLLLGIIPPVLFAIHSELVLFAPILLPGFLLVLLLFRPQGVQPWQLIHVSWNDEHIAVVSGVSSDYLARLPEFDPSIFDEEVRPSHVSAMRKWLDQLTQ